MNYIIFFKTALLRDKLINLDPGVKHLDDTRVESSPSVNKKIKHHPQFPSMEGCRAAAGWSENARMRRVSLSSRALNSPLSSIGAVSPGSR